MSRRTEPSRSPSSSSRKRSEEHTSELQSRLHLVCRLLLEKKTTETAELTASIGLKSPTEPMRNEQPHPHCPNGTSISCNRITTCAWPPARADSLIRIAMST